MDSILESEAKFYKRLQSNLKLVFLYENLSLLKYAVEILPTEELNTKATLKLSVLEDTEHNIAFEDLLLLELLNWFKFSFFTWVDIPKCESCGQIPKRNGTVPPNESEAVWGANTVEQYFCSQCQLNVRFPRYNHPRKLLETRKGRCGEWANCFTLLCRALGYDARLVFDWNDHVWTEVFSYNKKKWLHCDPCENVCDKPLLYEIGWKKSMSYVIAFSKDEIQDVTWRYTSKFLEVMSRRKLCREEWLLNCIIRFIENLQANTSSERKEQLSKRRALELAQFLTESKTDDETLSYRTSGSLAWRIARGEAHLATSHDTYMFNLCNSEIRQKFFHIKYNCAADKYVHVSDQFAEYDNWASCLYEYNNIFRKVEKDWKMTYLARTEGSDKGTMSWKFNFENTRLTMNTLKLNINCETFENGKINWIIFAVCNGNITKSYKTEGIVSLSTDEFKGSTNLTISVELTGGKGQLAWQHTQLFRQAVDSEEFPFEVQISFNET